MKRILALLLCLAVVMCFSVPVFAETTLEKINRTGVLTIGTRTGVQGFAFMNNKNEWVGFSIDLVEQAIAPEISKKLGKPIKVEKRSPHRPRVSPPDVEYG